MVTWEERNSDHLSINLNVSEEVAQIIKKRHLEIEEAQFAIYYGEMNNDTLYDEDDSNICLTKCIVGDGLFHAEYKLSEVDGDKCYTLLNLYACRTMIKD